MMGSLALRVGSKRWRCCWQVDLAWMILAVCWWSSSSSWTRRWVSSLVTMVIPCDRHRPPWSPFDRRGDLLPIHPTTLKVGENGVTAKNLWWVTLTLMVVNFHYCTGWTRPCCVPMDVKLSANQKKAIAGHG